MAELRGAPVRASSPQGRFTEGAVAVDGSVLEDVEAYAKHLLLRVAGERRVHVHLGMQGRWFRYDEPTTPPLPQVRLRLANDTVEGPARLAVPESEARKVYKQQSCRDCDAPVTTSAVGGRAAYHCPVEQPD